MKKLVALLTALAAFASLASALAADPLTQAALNNRRPDPIPTNGEYIILIGGVSLMEWEKFKAQPHDNWWANFVRAGRIRSEQIRAVAPNMKLTWLVYRPSYVARSKQERRNLLPFIDSVGDTFNFSIVYFNTQSELLSYLNNAPHRATMKICGLEFFGHSNKACMMFDYSNNLDSGSKCWLHEKELGKLNRGIFAPGAFVKSWGCHSGEMFCKSWYKATGTRMWGAVGKTQFMTDELPVLAQVNGRWTR
ncbi:MAG: hypothetical protein ABI680_03335 [Chthoniobacteraceae bacterium]